MTNYSTRTNPDGASRPVNKGALLAVICAANFMVTLDIAIVNVALPSLQADLQVDPSDLQWVVTIYALMLGGVLLLGGRAADLLGRRNVFVAGLVTFTLGSLVAGLSNDLAPLIAARAVQGIGAALVVPSALSILASSFAEGPERTKALGAFGAVGGSAATIGVIAGGALTSGPGWESIFLINVPIGVALVAFVLKVIPPSRRMTDQGADVVGALLVTAGLLMVVFAISKGPEYGWTSGDTIWRFALGFGLLAAFVAVESRVRDPLLPLSMFRRRTLSAANVVAGLVFASFFATIFQASLFMQQVLGYSAIRTGLAYLPIAATTVVVAAALAPAVIGKVGTGAGLAGAQVVAAAGLLVLSRAPADASYWTDVAPGFVLIGIGTGFAAMASEVAAFIGVEERFSGLAGGMVETSREVGGALGVAIVGTLALARTNDVLASLGGAPEAQGIALAEGFQRGSVIAAGFALAAAIAAAFVLRPAERATLAAAPAEPAVEATV